VNIRWQNRVETLSIRSFARRSRAKDACYYSQVDDDIGHCDNLTLYHQEPQQQTDGNSDDDEPTSDLPMLKSADFFSAHIDPSTSPCLP
jgi:hypothetical protein